MNDREVFLGAGGVIEDRTWYGPGTAIELDKITPEQQAEQIRRFSKKRPEEALVVREKLVDK